MQSLPATHQPVVSARFDHAVQLHKQGQIEQAEKIYQEVAAESPDHAGVMHMLGVILLQRGEFAQALESIGNAIRLDPSKAVQFNNYGAALHGLGRYVEALTSFHRAAEIRPKYADALSNVGMAYESLGRLEHAAQYYRQALEASPRHQDARQKSASLAQKLDDAGQAIQLCQELLKTEPTAELHLRMGNLLLAGGNSQLAIDHYRSALEIDPGNAAAAFNLGNAFHEQHRVVEARQQFAKAAELRPRQSFWRLRSDISCRAVFESTQQIDDFCAELSVKLDHWIESPPKASLQELVAASAIPNFTYSYLGRNVRPLKEKVARLYRHYFKDRPVATGSGLATKKRIGFVVTHRHEGIFVRCMKGIIEKLDHDLFEVVVLCSNLGLKRLQQELSRAGLRFVTFSNVLPEAADVIQRAACDVLYHWEVGSDSLNYFLPFCRLAPVQCTSHGSQITSGNADIDYYYSSALIELPQAQEHYTERLWNSQTLLMDQPRLIAPPPAQRTDFGLPDDRNLYVSLQNPLKFHPDFDHLIKGILEQDRRGVVVLLRGSFEFAEQQLRARFARTLGEVQERVIYLPYQKFQGYLQLISLADVFIDPLHFGAGSSAYDVFSLNCPLVTLPTPLNTGRIAAAMYEKMQLPELIAQDAEHYVHLATKLGTDADYRISVRRALSERSEVLFNDLDAVRDHDRFFAEISR